MNMKEITEITRRNTDGSYSCSLTASREGKTKRIVADQDSREDAVNEAYRMLFGMEANT